MRHGLRGLAAALLLAPMLALGAISVTIKTGVAPPPLPVYEQPAVPGPGYLWVPGYWSWDDEDDAFYWVPGTWVLPPAAGLYWTPGYWAWEGNAYVWHPGYWAPEVGYYGGIYYGFGYPGTGYYGGRWDGDVFHYNTAVTKVDVTTVQHHYHAPVTASVTVNNVSFNGGKGGVKAQPSAEELRIEGRVEASAEQVQHERAAAQLKTQLGGEGSGKPQVLSTTRVGELEASGSLSGTVKGAASGAVGGAATTTRSRQGSSSTGSASTLPGSGDIGVSGSAGATGTASTPSTRARDQTPGHEKRVPGATGEGEAAAFESTPGSAREHAPGHEKREPMSDSLGSADSSGSAGADATTSPSGGTPDDPASRSSNSSSGGGDSAQPYAPGHEKRAGEPEEADAAAFETPPPAQPVEAETVPGAEPGSSESQTGVSGEKEKEKRKTERKPAGN